MQFKYYNSPCSEIILASVQATAYVRAIEQMPCAERNKHRLMRRLNAEMHHCPLCRPEETKKNFDEYFAGKAIHSKFSTSRWKCSSKCAASLT